MGEDGMIWMQRGGEAQRVAEAAIPALVGPLCYAAWPIPSSFLPSSSFPVIVLYLPFKQPTYSFKVLVFLLLTLPVLNSLESRHCLFVVCDVVLVTHVPYWSLETPSSDFGVCLCSVRECVPE